MINQSHEDITRRQYNNMGHAYDADTKAFNCQVAYPRIIHELRTADVQPSATVIDIGCGSGRLMAALQKAEYRTHGIDLSTISVLSAQMQGLSAVEGSMTHLPFSGESCDATVSYHAFNYLPHDLQSKALQEQHRVLRTGGVCVLVAFFTPEERTSPLHIEQHGETFTLYLRTEDELSALFSAAGFSVMHTEALICTADETLLAPEHLRPLIDGRPYGQLIVGRRV